MKRPLCAPATGPLSLQAGLHPVFFSPLTLFVFLPLSNCRLFFVKRRYLSCLPPDRHREASRVIYLRNSIVVFGDSTTGYVLVPGGEQAFV